MNIPRAFLLALLVSPQAAAQNDMGPMPGMKIPTARAPQKTAAPNAGRGAWPPAKPSPHASMPGMAMPMAKEPQKAPKRPRAFLRPAKPMPGMAMPEDHSRKKTNSHESTSPAHHGSMPGMNMGAPGTKDTKSASPNSMPGMNMGAARDKSASPDAPSQKAMPGMDHMSMGHDMSAMASTGVFGFYPMTRDASGTSWQPDDAAHTGVHAMAGDWMLMGHMMLLGVYDNQSGPRGDEKVFPAGMLMGMARRDLSDSDTINFRAMLSPDPFMGRSGYPSLLASGQTANGVTHLIDRQHPHDLVIEMSGAYSHKFSSDDSAFLYFGYPGEPALGPPAFIHRASAMADPPAPIPHHWLDSTHIIFGVATAGFVHNDWKLEVSQFTGREPDQFRFNFDQARFDSTAARISWNPDQHWSLQASWGHLNSPEQL